MIAGAIGKERSVEHSRYFEKIKKYFDEGIWPIGWVRNAVGKKITPEEYEEITGEPYNEG